MRGLLVACGALLVGCSAVTGPLLHEVAQADVLADAGRDGAAATLPIEQHMSWQYQLTGALELELDVDLFVIDLFEADAADIAQLHADDKVAVAYLSAGTRESFRSDASDFPDEAVGNTHAVYPDEAWLDVRAESVRAIMAARMELARSKGFDGLVPTNMSGYLHDTGFELSAADQRAYSEWLTREAHALGLYVGMTDDFEQVAQLAQHYDWAIHFGCIERGDCDELDVFVEQGKPVLDVETLDAASESDSTDVCAQGAALGLNVLLKRPQFDADRVGCL